MIDVLESLDGGEDVQQLADDEGPKLDKSLYGLADEHQHISRRQLILVTQELNQLSSENKRTHTHVKGKNQAQQLRTALQPGASQSWARASAHLCNV